VSRKRNKMTPKFSEVTLTPPWVDGQHRYYSYPRNKLSNNAEACDEATLRKFISERSLVHKEFIREAERTRRLGYGLSAGLLGVAVVAPIVAPEGREAISVLTSGGLSLFAAGAFGYSKLKVTALKQKLIAEKK
jgi:hypothetical protein